MLYVNSNAGGIEMVIDLFNLNYFFVVIWECIWWVWNFVEVGVGIGIYESIDGGDIWKLISGSCSGFFNGEGVGCIGLVMVY